jgi:hypothetical protein
MTDDIALLAQRSHNCWLRSVLLSYRLCWCRGCAPLSRLILGVAIT